MNHPDYMDYPFVCDEKLGERCKQQCAVCKEGEARRIKDPKKYWEEVSAALREREGE